MSAHQDDADRLAAYLGFAVGRPLKLREILEALQVSKTRYYAQRDDGTLIRPDNLVKAARNLDINPVDLLAEFGCIGDEEVLRSADRIAPIHPRAALGTEGVNAAASTATLTPTKLGGRQRGRRSPRADVPPLM